MSVYRLHPITTTYKVPKVVHTRMYFQVNKVEQMDAPRAYNYYYLFRFFLGVKANVTGYKATFTYGNTYWDYTIQIQSWGQSLPFFFFFIVYETLPYVNVASAVIWHWREKHIPTLVFWEVNYYTEKKTNLGLFELMDPMQCEYTTNSGEATVFLLNSYKFHPRYEPKS